MASSSCGNTHIYVVCEEKKKGTMKTISCIVPAFNEEVQINKTLQALLPLLGNEIYEIIVVDDCSSDRTKDIVRRYPRVRLLEQEINKGKSSAVARGIGESQGEYIALIDADLIGLTTSDVSRLIAPVFEEKSDISISLRRNSPLLMRMIGIDYMSGERIFPKAMLEGVLPAMHILPNMALEVFLNRIIIAHHYRIASVVWMGVDNYFKFKKRGFLKGWLLELIMIKDMFTVISPWEVVSQNIQMRKLLVIYERI